MNPTLGQSISTLVNQGQLAPPVDPAIQAAQQLAQQPQATPNQAQQQLPTQQTILSNAYPITQNFGNYNPSLETFSGGYAMDTNFGAQNGDSVALPPGQWRIVNLNDTASQDGHPGNGENAGYGRAILAQNMQTGDRLHFIHLHDINANLGDYMQGGQTIGKVGHSGNATGDNLGLEYYDPNGQIGDVMQSPYAQYIMPSQQ